MQPQNIFENIPLHLPEEQIESLCGSEHVRIERIVSRGHASPHGFWYDQNENEYVLLLRGRASVRFENAEEPLLMLPGDQIVIPAGLKHRVEWTDPDQDTIWLAVFYPI